LQWFYIKKIGIIGIMLNGSQNPLNGLRDIHYPEPVSWWPPAIGWWAVSFLSIFFFVVTFRITYRYWKKKQQKRLLLQEFQKISQHHHIANSNIVGALSVFIKRVAMLHYPRQHIAALKGQEWINFLNDMTKQPYFTAEVGEELITAPYQSTSPQHTTLLLSATEQWLKQM
jgi:hypothetical protein